MKQTYAVLYKPEHVVQNAGGTRDFLGEDSEAAISEAGGREMTIELTQNELRALVAERAMNIHVMALSASTIRHTAEEIKDQVNRLNVLAAGLVGV